MNTTIVFAYLVFHFFVLNLEPYLNFIILNRPKKHKNNFWRDFEKFITVILTANCIPELNKQIVPHSSDGSSKFWGIYKFPKYDFFVRYFTCAFYRNSPAKERKIILLDNNRLFPFFCRRSGHLTKSLFFQRVRSIDSYDMFSFHLQIIHTK